jgi:hypothetical protein
MCKIQVAFLLLITLRFTEVAYAQGDHTFLIKAFNCVAKPKSRTQTDFRI